VTPKPTEGLFGIFLGAERLTCSTPFADRRRSGVELARKEEIVAVGPPGLVLVEERFAPERMVGDYERSYRAAISGAG
jgi:hypothetical protein